MDNSQNGDSASDASPLMATQVSDSTVHQASVSPAVDANTSGATDLRSVLEHLVNLGAAFDSKLRYDAKKDEQIEQLHAELETYKRGERDSMQRAILVDMIRLHDDMDNMIANSGLLDDAPMRRSLVAFQKSIIETLMRHGVEPYRADGLAYDRALQRVLQTAPTQNPELDMMVARRVRVGFRTAERIIRQELVDIYRLTQQ